MEHLVNEGETYIHGQSAEKARELLAKAEELGLDNRVVQSTSFGFVVPTAVAEGIESTKQIPEETVPVEVPGGDTREDILPVLTRGELDPGKDEGDDDGVKVDGKLIVDGEIKPGDEADAEAARVEAEADAEAARLQAEADAQAEANAERQKSEEVHKFDPFEHNVVEVQDYLETADDAESERVLALERNGKARKSLLPVTEGE